MSSRFDAPMTATDLDMAVGAAFRRIAPSWPLDRFIAVNPYWGYLDQPIDRAFAELGAVAGTRGLMPRSYVRAAWRNGELQAGHLREAVAEEGSDHSVEQLIAALESPSPSPDRLPLLSDCLDATRDLSHVMSWRDVVTHQISQFCAPHFDEHQAHWHPERSRGLFERWRAQMPHDHTVSLLTGDRRIARRALDLPAQADAMLAHGAAQLGVPAAAMADYLTALLASVNGWAAWCAFRRWEARLSGGDDRQIEELLAIRLAWECLLDDGKRGPGSVHAAWARAWEDAVSTVDERHQHARIDWVWQRALELAYQRPLSLALASVAPPVSGRPQMQAVFCIDVRSEVMRRALETVAPGVHTLGFAGFFGLPIAYTSLGSSTARLQLPGLLTPTLEAVDMVDDPSRQASAVSTRQAHDAEERNWHELQSLPASIFSFVESCGLFYLPDLLRQGRPSHGGVRSTGDVDVAVEGTPVVRPALSAPAPDDMEARAGLAERVLRGMTLTVNFGRVVLLVGHGSQSANNAHAAGLDCGACGGQTGEVNARVLAGLLNTPGVRDRLRLKGIDLPDDTWVLAAMHNTTTDEVRLFDVDLVPATHAADLRALRLALDHAGDRARVERAPLLGMTPGETPEQRLEQYRARATDWAQVRPEWGLAGNAAFIVAPRSRTRAVDLDGRAFLHEYDCRLDADGAVLAQIMTAPMVVANWINMQYFASVVDNEHFGSGNKLLHNVVGGRIGVFEGNGGDLRIGLPMQSVHDGQAWVHRPLRLSVFIEASRDAIDAVIAQHAVVRQLVAHGWLHLFRLDPEADGVEAWRHEGWEAML